MECSAKEPVSAPRKGGGTANFGVDMSLSPMHPHTCPPLGCRCLVAQLLERIIDHHAGASKSGSTAFVDRSRQICLKSATNRNVFYRGVAKWSLSVAGFSALYLRRHRWGMYANMPPG